jgi:hypothetical protein
VDFARLSVQVPIRGAVTGPCIAITDIDAGTKNALAAMTIRFMAKLREV